MTARMFSCIAFTLALGTLAPACSRDWATAPRGAASRPGLGTSWGETRESRVRSVEFERDDTEQPASLATLRYDDREGLRAQAGGLVSSMDGVALVDGRVRVRLLDASGRPLQHFNRGASDYVEGRRGERYLIEVDNRSPDRFEAVATVDGRDVMDGEPGSLAKRGYLIGPLSTLRIEGFRRNLDQVAAFRFGAIEDSYAARTGDDSNVGVIAVALFGERGWQRVGRAAEAERRRSADPFPAQFAAPPPRW
jgi:hypothetical protein